MRNKLVALLLILPLALGLVGCKSGGTAAPPETVEGEQPVRFELSEYEINTVSGKRVDLPVPLFIGRETIPADDAEVEILASDGSVFVPAYRYSALTTFRPYAAGAYYAMYTATNGGRQYRKTAGIYCVDADKDDIVVDGVLNDAKYAEIPTWRTGINGNMSVKLAFGQSGLYLGVEVLDDNLIYNTYVSKKFLQSDGFEVCLDLGGEFAPQLNEKCLKVQMNVNGVLWISRASSSLALYELDERLVTCSEHAVSYIGTRTDVAGDDFKTYTDTDVGYVLELYIPFNLLGFSDVADVIGISCCHRDVSSNVQNEYQTNGSGNQYFTEAALPDSFVETNNSGTSYEFEHMQGTSMTSLYNKCYLTGVKGVAESRNACAAVVDGVCDEALWDSADELPALTAIATDNAQAVLTAKVLAASEGLYVFASVTDGAVSENSSADVFANDCVQLNIAAAGDIGRTSLPAGCDIFSRSLTVSSTGQVKCAYLNNAGYEFAGGFDYAKAVRRTAEGYDIEIFIPAYEIGLDKAELAGVCVGLINCDGVKTARTDMVYSCDRSAPNTYEIVLKR